MLRKPLFIVFEGLDRSGKSTQVKLLHEYLASINCISSIIKFPNRETNIGKTIDSYLRQESSIPDEVIHLLFTANRWEAVPKIQELLSKREIVICDRYSYSGIAYSSAKEGLSFQWCSAVEAGLPKPDIVLFLHVPLDEIVRRNGFGDEIYERRGYQAKVLTNFQQLMTDCSVNWRQIDANQSVVAVLDDIKAVIDDLLLSVE